MYKKNQLSHKGHNWYKIKIPAVTKVEEWTKAEIGVGAAIAAGNQEEKGNWALLVEKSNNRINIVIFVIPKSLLLKSKVWKKRNLIIAINIISPNRLEKIVIEPALKDFWLL